MNRKLAVGGDRRVRIVGGGKIAGRWWGRGGGDSGGMRDSFVKKRPRAWWWSVANFRGPGIFYLLKCLRKDLRWLSCSAIEGKNKEVKKLK